MKKFRRHIIFSGLLLLAGLCALVAICLFPNESDAREYGQLVASSKPIVDLRSEDAPVAIQHREGVKKDLWLMQDGQRLHSQFVSHNSDVSFFHKGKGIEVTEELHQIEGSIEIAQISTPKTKSSLESKSESKPETMFIRSRTARYGKELLTLTGDVFLLHALGEMQAENAALRRAPHGGAQLGLQDLELKDNVIVRLNNGVLPQGGMADVTSQQIYWDESKHTLTLTGQVYYKDRLGEVWADEMVFYYDVEAENRLEPKYALLTGHVKMLNDAPYNVTSAAPPVLQFALADQVDYFPQTGQLLFDSKEGNRVLYFDKIRDMQVSAKTLRAQRQTPQAKESVQGEGDVHMTFSEGEWDRLKQQFSLN